MFKTRQYSKELKKIALSVVLNIGMSVLKDTLPVAQYTKLKKLRSIIIGGTIVYSLLQS